jgi:competence protein ComEC
MDRFVLRGRAWGTRVPVELTGGPVQGLRYGEVVDVTAAGRPAWSPQSRSLSLRVIAVVGQRAPPGPVDRATTGIRAAFRRACAGLPADAGALLLGLAVGDESTVSPELDRAMIRSGLAHLTAVSGTNTSLVAGLALAAAAAAGLGWRSRVACGLLVLAGYVALVRPQPSVLRAAAMGCVALLALSRGGRRRGPPALLAACLVLLVVLPEYAVSLGFALSAAATAGLLMVGPAIAERLGRTPVVRRVPEPVRVALAVAAAAHLTTLPLAVLLGNGASLVALPANVVVTPLVPVATVLGLVAALVAPFLPALASGLAHAASPATLLIAEVAHRSARVPGGVVDIPAGPWAAVGTALAVAGVLVAVHRNVRLRDPRVLRWAAAMLAVGLVCRHLVDSRWPPRDWVILACDVGQGDALLMRAAGSRDAVLVDVGPDPRGVVECVRDAGVRPVGVLLSHYHDDHVGGLAGVLDAWPVQWVLASPVRLPTEGAAVVAAHARESNAAVRPMRAGDRLRLGAIMLSVLWPARPMRQSPANNSSVVAVAEIPLRAGSVRLLLTGDVEPEAQRALMGGPPPAVDVVKVPHHGSPHQDPGFARWAGARIALVTVGAVNDYGHPSAATLAQYARGGAQVGRTDRDGALAVVVAGGGPALFVQR